MENEVFVKVNTFKLCLDESVLLERTTGVNQCRVNQCRMWIIVNSFTLVILYLSTVSWTTLVSDVPLITPRMMISIDQWATKQALTIS